MAVELSPKTVETLEAYAEDRLDIRQLAAWLAQAAYDDELDTEERNELARVDLVVTEVREKMRPEDEARVAVRAPRDGAAFTSRAPRQRSMISDDASGAGRGFGAAPSAR
jgi:hypothetical protein